jgi:hypothetical protein
LFHAHDFPFGSIVRCLIAFWKKIFGGPEAKQLAASQAALEAQKAADERLGLRRPWRQPIKPGEKPSGTAENCGERLAAKENATRKRAGISGCRVQAGDRKKPRSTEA